MEKKFYTDDNFERLLREQADRFTMPPTKRVWNSVYNNLHPARKWPSVAISLLLVISILMLGYLNKTSNSENKPSTTYTAADKLLLTNAASEPSLQSNAGTSATINNTIAPGNTASAHISIAGNIHSNQTTAHNTPVAIHNGRINNTGISTTNVIALKGEREKERRSEAGRAGERQNTVNAQNKNASADIGVASANMKASVSIIPSTTTTSVSLNNAEVKSNATTSVTGNTTEDNTNESAVSEKEIATENKLEKKVDAIDANTKQLLKTADEAAKQKTATSMKTAKLSTEDKAWIDDHAFYNKRNRGRWKNKLSWNIYVTPSVSYRVLFDNTKSGDIGTNTTTFPPRLQSDKEIEKNVTHKPGLGMEAGAGIVYTLSKKWRLKAGVQGNYNSYGVYANEIAHPFGTTLPLNNLNTGNLDVESRFTSISNIDGGRNTRLNSYSYQLALPVGFDYKIKGNNTINWYAGASLQPSFILAGNTYLLSADRQAYIETKHDDKLLMRKFNLAFGAETFVSYKRGNYTFMAGPKLRYQLLTTNNHTVTVGERAFGFGLSLGLLKGF